MSFVLALAKYLFFGTVFLFWLCFSVEEKSADPSTMRSTQEDKTQDVTDPQASTSTEMME